MSIAPCQLPPTGSPEWWPLVAAAKVIGVNPDALGRALHEKGLIDAGFAKYDRDRANGPKKLFVHRSHHPALIGGEFLARHTESDLSQFTKKQREVALLRRLCVDRLRHARATAPMSIRMADLVNRIVRQAREEFPALKISRGTLYKWDSLFDIPANLHRLVDKRGGDQKTQGCNEAWSAFRDLYLHENQPTVKFCWRAAKRIAAENGWEWCSYSSCRRQVDDRIPPEIQTFHRTPAQYRNSLAPFIPQDAESWRAGELYISDHKSLDVVCRWRNNVIRPWLTCWMDWRTRKVCGWTLSEIPNSTTILAALKNALTDPSNMGGPSKVRIDHGRDFEAFTFHGLTKRMRRSQIRPDADAKQMAGTFNLLGIEAGFAQPYNPQGKARCERWFGNLTDFARTFDTYTGIDVESKPERLAEILKNSPHRIPTFEAVRDRLADFIAAYNQSADHAIDDLVDAGERLSPAVAFSRWCDTKRIMADPASLDLILQHWHKPVTIGRNGISLTIAGRVMKYGQFEPALMPFKAASKKDRKPVNVSYDADALGSVRVYDEKYKFVCTATANLIGGANFGREAIARMQREKSLYRRSAENVARLGFTTCLTTEEHARDAAIRSRKEQQPQPAAHMKIQSSPLDGQGKHLQRQELKKAVGAESVEPPETRGPSMLEMLKRNLTPREPREEIGTRSPLELLEALRHG